MMLTTTRGGFELHTWGSGRLVLALHPLALSGRVWEPVAGNLSGCEVVGLDARGHGSSAWDGEPFTVEDMARDAAAVIETLDRGPASVIGMSMGGCTAIALATGYPHLVDRLVLADTTSWYGEDRLEKWEQRAAIASTKPRKEQVAFQLDRWFSEAFRQQRPEVVDHVVDIFVATDSSVHAAACRALGAFDAREGLRDISTDTLVLVGDEDYATPVEMAGLLAERIPGAQLEVLPATRHLSLVENQAAWSRIQRHLDDRHAE